MAGLKIISRIAAALDANRRTADARFSVIAAQIANLRRRVDQLEGLKRDAQEACTDRNKVAGAVAHQERNSRIG